MADHSHSHAHSHSTADHFDQRAATWDADPRHQRRAQVDAEAIASAVALTPETRALEFGCGTGLLGFRLLPKIGELTLCDNSSGMIEVLRKRIAETSAANVHALHADLTTGDLPPGPFDLIYTTMVLHHVKDVADLIQRFARMLAPGGRLVLIDLSAEDGSFHGDAPVPHNGFAPETLRAWVTQAGLKVESARPFDTMEKEGRSYQRLMLVASAV